jgi:lipid-binding SYLF domain-containing protein
MKKTAIFLAVAFVFGIATLAVAADQADYSKTIETFRSDPVVADFFKNSYGYAVFPTVGKAGFVVGGSYGKGQVYKRGKVSGTSKMMEGSIGFQIGGEAFSEIVFFEDQRAYDEFTSGNFEFGAEVQAVAVTAGAQAQASTAGASAGATAGPKTNKQAETKYHKGMVTFVHTKGGLMAGMSVSGQKFTFTPM